MCIRDRGNDTYAFSGNFSTSYDVVTELAGGGSDTIRILSDIPASAVRLQGTTSNGLWVIADGYGSVYLGNQLATPNVEWLQIGSNAPISLTSGLTMAGSASSETIYGSAFNDTINGKGGNDTLIGGLGNDTYEFSGNFSTSYDVITEDVYKRQN